MSSEMEERLMRRDELEAAIDYHEDRIRSHEHELVALLQELMKLDAETHNACAADPCYECLDKARREARHTP